MKYNMNPILGALTGDIVGSVYEWHNIKTKAFPLFNNKCVPTDDSVMTLAVTKALIGSRETGKPLAEEAVYCMRQLGNAYPRAGYGGRFAHWLTADDPTPYNSFGNGSAMRTSACGVFADTLEEALKNAREAAAVTHNHPEGIKGAEATAAAIFMALHGSTKDEIRGYVVNHYYTLGFTLDEIRPAYRFDETCQGSVPQAIEAFLEAKDFEDTIRSAISLGGDSDTLAAIAGSIGAAFYGVPQVIGECTLSYLDKDLRGIYDEAARYAGNN